MDLTQLSDLLTKPDVNNYSQKIKFLLKKLGRYDARSFDRLISDPEFRQKILESLQRAIERQRSRNPTTMGQIADVETLRLYNQLYRNLLIFSWPEVGDVLSRLGYSPKLAERLESDPALRTQTIQIMRDKIDQWQTESGFNLDSLLVDPNIPDYVTGMAQNMLGPDFTQELFRSGAKSLKFQALARLPGGIAAIEKHYGLQITGNVDKFLKNYNDKYYTLECGLYNSEADCAIHKIKCLAEMGDYEGVTETLKSTPSANIGLRQEMTITALNIFAGLGRKDLISQLVEFATENIIAIPDQYVDGTYALYAAFKGDVDDFIFHLSRMYGDAPPQDVGNDDWNSDVEDYDEYSFHSETWTIYKDGLSVAIKNNHIEFLEELSARHNELGFVGLHGENEIRNDIITEAVSMHRFDIVDALGGFGDDIDDILMDAVKTCDKEVIDRCFDAMRRKGSKNTFSFELAIDNDCPAMIDKFLLDLDPIVAGHSLYDNMFGFTSLKSHHKAFVVTELERMLIGMAGKNMAKQLIPLLDAYTGSRYSRITDLVRVVMLMLNNAHRNNRYDTFEVILNHPAIAPHLDQLWSRVIDQQDITDIDPLCRYKIIKNMLIRGRAPVKPGLGDLDLAVASSDPAAARALVDWMLDKGENIPQADYKELVLLNRSLLPRTRIPSEPYPSEEVLVQLKRLLPLVV